ncbi:alpha/beta fold hydrolase [Planktosalinus lacus]|uniref:Alpha/beta hydrolase n=1 Tax=Planktosalinus lacus TaxID=1526573 RepID=A0A8J2VB02_9FLAO|nr:alpha/beta hydrolase [Planktosalinus lacus]GGD95142.1 alpha/beta hydrolase [Planktosalinus lacus]
MKTSHILFSKFFIGILFLFLSSTLVFSQTQETSINERSDAIGIIEELRKIHTPEGIEILEQVELGGVPQWVSIRGRNQDNPVLLFIPGGWGDPMIGLSWAFQTPWEDYFTVVQWDHRNAGKNAIIGTDREAFMKEFTLERLVSDAEELVSYLRERLGKDKVVAMGYSMGGTVGIHLAKQRPEWLHAYVGIGQVSHNLEQALYDRTLELALAAGNDKAVAELKPYASYTESERIAIDTVKWNTRKWANTFDGAWYGKGGWSLYLDLPSLAPEYTDENVIAWKEGLYLLNTENNTGRKDLRELGPNFQIPVLFFHGRYDLTPPVENARTYFEWIEAPHKRMVIFERSAHIPFLEEPGRFFAALLEHVLPLTEGVATYEVRR